MLLVQDSPIGHSRTSDSVHGTAGELNLHKLSEAGAEVALRAWLRELQQQAAAGRRLDKAHLCIITGALPHNQPSPKP